MISAFVFQSSVSGSPISQDKGFASISISRIPGIFYGCLMCYLFVCYTHDNLDYRFNLSLHFSSIVMYNVNNRESQLAYSLPNLRTMFKNRFREQPKRFLLTVVIPSDKTNDHNHNDQKLIIRHFDSFPKVSRLTSSAFDMVSYT